LGKEKVDSQVLKNIYICYPEGKHKVLTMSYDDGKLEDRKLISIFNRYGIKGSFHLNSGLDGEQYIPSSEYIELYRGHEVSAHTSTHPTISRSPIEQVALQVLKDRKELEEIMGYPVRGLSYPNGSYSEPIKKLLPSIGIRYARIVGNSDGFALPSDYYEWKATCHHNHNLLQLGKEFCSLFKTQYLYMMYVWGHSYEFTIDNNWELMEKFCELVGGREDIWYATNIEIVDYMEAADRLRFTVGGDKVYNPSYDSVWISVNGKVLEIKGGTSVTLDI
jgi:hypothetical protein